MMTFSDPTVEAVKAQLSQGLTLQGYCNSVLRQPYVNFSDFSSKILEAINSKSFRSCSCQFLLACFLHRRCLLLSVLDSFKHSLHTLRLFAKRYIFRLCKKKNGCNDKNERIVCLYCLLLCLVANQDLLLVQYLLHN